MTNTFKTTLGRAKHFFDTYEQDKKKLINLKRARTRAANKALKVARLTPKPRTRTKNFLDESLEESRMQVENNDQTKVENNDQTKVENNDQTETDQANSVDFWSRPGQIPRNIAIGVYQKPQLTLGNTNLKPIFVISDEYDDESDEKESKPLLHVKKRSSLVKPGRKAKNKSMTYLSKVETARNIAHSIGQRMNDKLMEKKLDLDNEILLRIKTLDQQQIALTRRELKSLSNKSGWLTDTVIINTY